MTDVGSVYGSALYTLAREEDLSASVLEELTALEQSFRQEPGFLKLLSSPALSKDERCKILDDSFRGKVQPYVLNFMKILTEKGYLRHFSDCCKAYREQYNQDNGHSIKKFTGKWVAQDMLINHQQGGGVECDTEKQVAWAWGPRGRQGSCWRRRHTTLPSS